ncbi:MULTISPECIES: thiamine pyrophosphate-binding protein [unclassified Streptomyces]|uniref:thiamine pyrophosphate-binding protein n=1 Tax=unclassified Streptomyces TaxID=2593676 RepID=UPI00210A8DC6|nr:thiamine pyrophosphate-binding protein [Streptomyces sp. DvalAA-14]
MAQDVAVRSAQRVLETLDSQGVRHIFGVPGAKIDAVYDALADGGPRLVVRRHEQNAAFMAAAVGRLTGTPGVVLVTSGQTLTKFTGEVGDPDHVAETVMNALRAAVTEPRGSAAVVLPTDVLAAKTSATLTHPLPVGRLGPAPADGIRRAAELVRGARRPVLLEGARAADPDSCAALRDLIAGTGLTGPPPRRFRRGPAAGARRGGRVGCRCAGRLPPQHRSGRPTARGSL